jgi:DNA-directed RNA polymerase subunit M/transcription elongation factor TFIIS
MNADSITENPDPESWAHPVFNSIRDKIEEENRFIENPVVDIAEGIIQCNKCKSYKTFSYQKQVRSSDEGFTLFVNCVDCNSSWVQN